MGFIRPISCHWRRKSAISKAELCLIPKCDLSMPFSPRWKGSVVPDASKSRSKSSHEWLTRHLNDPFVKRAKMENYRARSAFKLIEIDDRFKLFEPGQLVVDCGAAPGAWTQVATARVNARKIDSELPIGKVIAVDLLRISPVEGSVLYQGDFTAENVQQLIIKELNEKKAGVVLSDMAPNASGIATLDNDIICSLATTALIFAIKHLDVGGHFLCKVWDGQEREALEVHIKKFFETYKRVKPVASRLESSEMYLLGKQFKGVKTLQE